MGHRDIIHVWPEAPVVRGERILCRGVIERPGARRFNLDYWFPVASAESVSDRADAYACAALFLGTRHNLPLHIHGTVSPALLRNLDEFQRAWHCLKPEWYTPVQIDADHESEATGGNERPGALLSFSGGVDASYSLWRHTRGDAGRQRRPIGATVLVHGFDIELSETEGFERARRRAEAITASAGVPLICAATNFRALPMDWEQAHGAAVASVHLLLQRGYGCGLIAGGYTYKNMALPWGSQPLTDWMFSAGAYPIVHDAGFAYREQKTIALATWPEARKNLRVCYQTQVGNNCGACFKCMRTLLLFRAVGGGLPECFDRDMDDEFIRRAPQRHMPASFARLAGEILDAAKRHGTEGSWTVALAEARRDFLRRQGGPGWFERLRTRVALRTRLRGWIGRQAPAPVASGAGKRAPFAPSSDEPQSGAHGTIGAMRRLS